MTKNELRIFYKKERGKLTDSAILKYDDLLLIQFQKLYFDKAKILLSYLPMNNEPNTPIYATYLKHSIPNLQIAYPVTNFKNNSMQAFLVDNHTNFTTNSYGLTEPINGIEINATEIDIVFVPLLICDVNGYRVGYGKGFYDRFLAQCKNDVIKVGFCYFNPVEKIDDKNNFDIPLNYCITPQKMYEF
jgi:5-formyltetrahydrofolate cyclo-ligase